MRTKRAIQLANLNPIKRTLTPDEFRFVGKYLGLKEDEFGDALGEVKLDLKRSRTSISLYVCGRMPISREVSMAAQTLLARKLKAEGVEIDTPFRFLDNDTSY